MNSISRIDAAAVQRGITQPVAFIDDVFRHSFWPAKEFFYDLLKVPFCKLLTRPPRPSVRQLMWKDGLLTPPSVLPGPTKDEQNWTLQYNALNDDAKQTLARYVDPECLYICYEASPGLQSFLNELGVTYIDVRISPLRFMQDVVLALRSNSPEINAVLSLATMTKTDIECEALMMAASWRHHDRYKRAQQAHAQQAPIYFVGQTATDASIIVGKNYFRIDDAIQIIGKEFEQRDIIYLRHPSADAAHVQRETAALAKVCRSLKMSDENSYDLLCSDQPGEFLGISSGLLQEAYFFGKQSLSLLPPVCPLSFPEDAADEGAAGYYQITFDTFLNARFWNSVFRRTPPEWRDTPRNMPLNQLRELHNVWWGYAAHKAKPTDYSRAQTREIQTQTSKLQNTTRFLMSIVSQAPDQADIRFSPLTAQRWRWPDGGEVSFGADGAVLKNGLRSGSWSGVAGKPEAAMVIWAGGEWIDLVELDQGGRQLRCRNNIGHGFIVSAL